MSMYEIQAKSILRKQKKIDSWFLARYGMNLYRGCMHGCVYCDGRDEKYNVQGCFDTEIAIKSNAAEILQKELNRGRKQKPLKPGFIFAGGGVNDSYQPIEQKLGLTRKVLQILSNYQFPVHILTKSVMVKRDADILEAIKNKNGAIISFSFSTVNKEVSCLFEPHASRPGERLEAIRFFKDKGFTCGAYLMPLIPFITDSTHDLEEAYQKIKAAGADFIIPAGLTLKKGRQRDFFMDTINRHFPYLKNQYGSVYDDSAWGIPKADYINKLDHCGYEAAKKFQVPIRIPLTVYGHCIDENDKIVVMLEHMAFLLQMHGKKTPFGYAAYQLSRLQVPIREMQPFLEQIKGIGPQTADIINEVLNTGTSRYYENLMGFKIK